MMEGSKQASSLEAFRKLLTSKDAENIPSGINEDEFLMRFLRFKTDPQRAYETLVKYQKFRKSDEELFSKLRPSALKSLIDTHVFTKLPGNDAEGRPVFLVDCKRWNPKEITAEHVVFLAVLFFEELSRSKECNATIMIDWTGFGMAMYRQIRLRDLTRGFSLLQGTFPVSFKAIHQVNQSSFFWLVSKIFFSLLSSKLRNRIYLHGTDRQSLAAHIPLSSLPVDYGGSSEEYMDVAFVETMYKNEDYYYKLNEHARKK
ncbi:Alpha-tocopherol transfer protein-like [Orchesella cincta]|uniref:Alpha-tocopherol transfer protein-like n=1 Tax=Orchesella cincta TaxID=48709 RepID=A0A1D2MPT4_ORCCI|nr:Alpha-tocopherol transfer protein-like [Orchesella cincta]